MLDLTQISAKRSADPPGPGFTLWLVLPLGKFKAGDFLCMCRVSTASPSTTTPKLDTGRGHPHRERGEVLGEMGASTSRQMGCWQQAQSPPAGRCCDFSPPSAASRLISMGLHQKQTKEKT